MAHIVRKTHPHAIPVAITVEAWILIASIFLSIWLTKSDVLALFASRAAEFEEISSFIAGIFFTSMLTTAPAVISLGELGQHIVPWKVALFGAAGAICGDILLFRFLHSPLANYVIHIALNPRLRRMGTALEKSGFWWIVPLLGAAIIASPLPDELGLLMMGLSGMRMWSFVALAYTMNVIGIYIIVLTAQTIAS